MRRIDQTLAFQMWQEMQGELSQKPFGEEGWDWLEFKTRMDGGALFDYTPFSREELEDLDHFYFVNSARGRHGYMLGVFNVEGHKTPSPITRSDDPLTSWLNYTFLTRSKHNGNHANVYVETDGVGHTYIKVNGTVFSYGRYDGSYSPSSGAFGPVGKGILFKKSGTDADAFIQNRFSLYPFSSVYRIDNVDADATFNFFNNLYENGQYNSSGGKYIDTYLLFGNNCTTIVCRGLREGGSLIPVYQSPLGLNSFLRDVERFKNGWNPGKLVPWEPKL